MKKLFILLGLVIFCINTISNLNAFCVYNKTDIEIKVKEVSGGKYLSSFEEKIKPGEKKCCHWSNKGCNKEGKRDSKLRFLVYDLMPYVKEVNGWEGGIICDAEILAGGALVVEGKNQNRDHNYRCTVVGY